MATELLKRCLQYNKVCSFFRASWPPPISCKNLSFSYTVLPLMFLNMNTSLFYPKYFSVFSFLRCDCVLLDINYLFICSKHRVHSQMLVPQWHTVAAKSISLLWQLRNSLMCLIAILACKLCACVTLKSPDNINRFICEGPL